MDGIDQALLGILQQDASISLSELADRVGLSPTPCWKRVQRMESSGVILGRVALVSPEAVGMGLTVFVGVEAWDHTPEWLRTFSATVSALPAVVDVYRMAGEIDYMMRVVVADMAEFDKFYKELIASVPVKNVTSRFAMERIKSTTAVPLHGPVFRDRRQPAVAQEN